MEVVVYDPAGDVLVTCNNTTFRLSSAALSLASPVFRAMFKGGFKEGISCARGEDGTTVNLPEDDVDAFRLFCDIAYHKCDSLPVNPTPGFLQRLSVFIDKYICREALRCVGQMWLERPLPGQVEDLLKLAQFAFVLDLETEFAKITREIILKCYTRSGDWSRHFAAVPLLPDSMLGLLNSCFLVDMFIT
ncbi:hypothetical protein BJY04DRAFT_222516 [Aspergillus karnatakaensis]|uniref:uncharacterized protein n=1 Tax=Aspergillus karnatakaensis TaxID=1810916 RepID=UPI003CCE4C40